MEKTELALEIVKLGRDSGIDQSLYRDAVHVLKAELDVKYPAVEPDCCADTCEENPYKK